MTEQTSISPTASGNSGLANVTILEPSRLLPWLALCCVLSGIAVAMSISVFYVQANSYRELEREVRLLQLQSDNMKVAMLAAGLDPAPHLRGENP